MAEQLLDFLSREKVKSPTIIGRGVLPVQGKLIIGGQPKRNKSFVALNMGLDLARGRNIFGAEYPNHTPVLPVQKSHRVLYIEQEIGEIGLDERLKGMCQSWEELIELPFYIKSRDLNLKLDTQEGRDAIERELAAVRPEVVILDPLVEFHSMDENSSQEMGMVLRVTTDWQERYKLSVILIHHAGHPNWEHKREGGDLLRGSTAIYGAADTIMIVESKSELSAKEPLLKLSFELRRGEPILPAYVKRLIDGHIEFIQEPKWIGKTSVVAAQSSGS